MMLEQLSELGSEDDAAHHLSRLGVVGASERGAIDEPEREPVPRLPGGVAERALHARLEDHAHDLLDGGGRSDHDVPRRLLAGRSEERRGGKAWGSGWA